MKRIATLAAAAMLLVGGLCSAATPASAASHHHHLAKTKQLVIRPVHRNGAPARGFRVDVPSYVSDFSCYAASQVSVSAGVLNCGYTYTSSNACWPSTEHTVLCLPDPFAKVLNRYYYTGSLNRRARTRTPSPMGLRLGDHQTCTIRTGGAWDRLAHYKNWYGTYGCARSAIYSPSGPGINKHSKRWTVYIFPNSHSYKHRRFVAKAYYVGTAR